MSCVSVSTHQRASSENEQGLLADWMPSSELPNFWVDLVDIFWETHKAQEGPMTPSLGLTTGHWENTHISLT